MSIITYHGVNLHNPCLFLILLAGEGIAAIARRQDHPRQTLKETGTSLAAATPFAVGNAGISVVRGRPLQLAVYVLTPIHPPDIWYSSTSVPLPPAPWSSRDLCGQTSCTTGDIAAVTRSA